MADWNAIAKRNSRSVQTTIGWIFWDPGAIQRYEALGLPGPIGYIAARCAPLAATGPEAVVAAFGSISPGAIAFTFDLVAASTDFVSVWNARNDAVVEGLREFAPAIVPALEQMGPSLWTVVEQLPTVGRVFYASHLGMERANDPLLSAWQAVNCIREWRGDTHWAIVASAGLTGIEASILHNAWLGYADGWLPTSRGSNPDEIRVGWELLADRGLAQNGVVTPLNFVSNLKMTRIGTRPFRGDSLARNCRLSSRNASNRRVNCSWVGWMKPQGPTINQRLDFEIDEKSSQRQAWRGLTAGRGFFSAVGAAGTTVRKRFVSPWGRLCHDHRDA